MPDHLETMRQEVMQTEKASFFKLHNLAGDRLRSSLAQIHVSTGQNRKFSHARAACMLQTALSWPSL